MLQEVVAWIREYLAWIVVSLAAGTLLAMKRGHSTLRAWVLVLFKSLLVGLFVMLAVRETDLAFGWQLLLAAFIVMGGDALLVVIDAFWTRVAADPLGFARAVVHFVFHRRIVIERGERPPAPPEPPEFLLDDKERDEKEEKGS